MTSILKVKNVSSEVMPGRGFLIGSMSVEPGDMVALVMNDRRLRWDLIELLDGSKKLENGSIDFFNKKGKKTSIRLATVTIDRNFLGDMTISEYMDHFRDLSDLSENKIKKEEILSSLHLSSVANCKIHTLPFHGQVFVELARSLYLEPELLIIDMANFPLGLDTDKTFMEIVKKWACSGRRACIVISHLPMINNPIFERVFHHQFGRIEEDTERPRTITTLDWDRFNLGVDNVGETIKILGGIEKVNVNGSQGDVVNISIDKDLEISDVNRELVKNGVGVISINSTGHVFGGLIP